MNKKTRRHRHQRADVNFADPEKKVNTIDHLPEFAKFHNKRRWILVLFFIKYGACPCSHDLRCWYVISETLLDLSNTKLSAKELQLLLIRKGV